MVCLSLASPVAPADASNSPPPMNMTRLSFSRSFSVRDKFLHCSSKEIRSIYAGAILNPRHQENNARRSIANEYFGQAFAQERAGRLVEAEKLYRLGLELHPHNPEVLSNLGCLLETLGKGKEAEVAHRKAVELAPGVAEMHNNLGLALQSIGKQDEAELSYKRAIELRADCIVARLNLGRLLQMSGRHTESIEHYEYVLKMEPSNARARNNLGIALEHIGDLMQATEAFQDAIATDAGLVAAHRRLAEIQQRQVPSWHVSMLNDKARNDAYQFALRNAINSDSTVLEIGTGAGLLSMFAARLGPRRLTTCEAEPLVAQAAREVIEINGFASRVSLIPKRSTELKLGVDLPEPANVLVFELFSSELLGERVLASIEDAKRRLLHPACRIIPASASLMIGLFGGEKLASNLCVQTVDGLDLSAFNRVVARRQVLNRDDLEIDLLSGDIEAFRFDFEKQSEWPAQRAQIRIPVTVEGRCHGIVQWLRLGVDRDTTFENHPRTQTITSHWRPALYLMPNPVNIRPGQMAVVNVVHDRLSPWFTVERFE